ncbi:uncharacterized protein [Rutidosis leptorrhynchoides]|uniref:uncharacterized protein n=1 Tax=Rutidosis leptorrhynchoides TaxID=125765 RepID=UPI003A9A1376
MTLKRIEMIKRKRNAMQKFLKNDVVDLLQTGLESNAYTRVEQLYADQLVSSSYEFVELSCSFILSQLSAMNKHRECPDECKEAISTLMFAAARFADLPELREIRSIFAERYGNYFEPYVNQEFVRNLKADPPSKEVKLQMLQDIALDSGIQWDCKPLELKLYKPPPFVQDHSLYANRNEPPKTHHQNGPETSQKETEQKTCNKQTVLANKDQTSKKGLPYKPRDEIETNVVNSFPYPLKIEVEKRESKRDHGRVSPYWSSNASSSGETITSPEYSTGPDDSATEDIPKGRNFNGFRSTAYIKTESTKKSTNGDAVSSSAMEDNNDTPPGRKVYGLRAMGPPYIKPDSTKKSTTSDEENISGFKFTDNDIEEVSENINKTVPRSMRNRRPFKPRGNNDVSRTSPKNQNGESLGHHDDKDDEERKMDRLLTHYSRKPTRTGSLPPQPLNTRVATDERKRFARAATYQPDSALSSQGHVHPKLPDYDDFVARLAVLRASS